jgi:hypothetical protein
VLAITNAIDVYAPVTGVLIVGSFIGMLVFIGVLLFLRPTLIGDIRDLWRLVVSKSS